MAQALDFRWKFNAIETIATDNECFSCILAYPKDKMRNFRFGYLTHYHTTPRCKIHIFRRKSNFSVKYLIHSSIIFNIQLICTQLIQPNVSVSRFRAEALSGLG